MKTTKLKTFAKFAAMFQFSDSTCYYLMKTVQLKSLRRNPSQYIAYYASDKLKDKAE